MDLQTAKTIVRQELNKLHCEYKEIESKTTNSVYYKIYFGKSDLQFRISDHRTKYDISTLRIDYKSSAKTIINYVHNRIQDAKDKELYAALNSNEKAVFSLDDLEF